MQEKVSKGRDMLLQKS